MQITVFLVVAIGLCCVQGFSFKRDDEQSDEIKESLVRLGTEVVRDDLGDKAAEIAEEVLTECLHKRGEETECLVEKAVKFCDHFELKAAGEKCRMVKEGMRAAGEFGEDLFDQCKDEMANGVEKAIECAGPVAEAHCNKQIDPEECLMEMKKYENKARKLFTERKGGKCDIDMVELGKEVARDEYEVEEEGDKAAEFVEKLLKECLESDDGRECLKGKALEICALAQWQEDGVECSGLQEEFDASWELGEDIHTKCREQFDGDVEEAIECARPIAIAHCGKRPNKEECIEYVGKYEDKARELCSEKRMLSKVNMVRSFLRTVRLQKQMLRKLH